MKKLIIIFTAVIVLVTSVYFAYSYFASFSTVTFNLAEGVKEIKVYKNSDDETGDTVVATLQSSGEVRINNGNYYVTPSGDNIVNDNISIKITGNISIDIDPDYNSDYLTKLADIESGKIAEVINRSLTPAIENYDIEQVKVYNKADWAGVLLLPKDIDIQNPSGIHRVVLKKEGDSWIVVGLPQIVMTAYNTKNVPLDVLKSVNDLVF
ncbi:MAG: hypothetical protein WBB94_03765 [Candidatus Saccharimonadaceae bacterium]